MSFGPTVFSYNATVLLVQPNPTQPMDGPNPCPSLARGKRIVSNPVNHGGVGNVLRGSGHWSTIHRVGGGGGGRSEMKHAQHRTSWSPWDYCRTVPCMDATAGNVLVSPAVYWTRRSTDCWKMHNFYLEVRNLVGSALPNPAVVVPRYARVCSISVFTF